MSSEILYHGSKDIIEKPIYLGGKSNNDYGYGFYCTKIIELAKEWASSDLQDCGYVNTYEIDTSNLAILDLTDNSYNILNWMAILVKYRTFDISSSIAKRAKTFLLDNYYIDVDKYDIIIGYRADDSYFRYAKDFLNNTISIQKLSKAMELGELGKQTVIKSEKAFKLLHFKGYELVNNTIYYAKKIARDKKAREQYYELEITGDKEIYINQIIEAGGYNAN